jgi:ribosomal-protein-alanine N-acetyltransferase
MKKIAVQVRWVLKREMPEVLSIDRRGFEFPWLEEDFTRRLGKCNVICMVARHGENVVGFMVYEMHETRLHILKFAVCPKCRRRGVGNQMIAKLTGKLCSPSRDRILLEVRETNLVAQLFFRSVGFRATAVLRNWYEHTAEDAYQMEYRLEPHEDRVTKHCQETS